ncbi:MAG TPA: cytochrome c oxidase subunit II, partial [Streptosporangiaceae bacterium]
MTVALVLVVLGLTGCTNDTFTRLGFPNPITEQGKTVLTLWQGSWIAGLAVGAVVWGLILWAVIFHR